MDSKHDCLYLQPDWNGECCHCSFCEYCLRRIAAKSVIPKRVYDSENFVSTMRELSFIEYKLKNP